MVQQRSIITRQRILACSLDLFSRRGYTNTGVSEICSASGISKGAFYHHFTSKQAVFLAILEEWLGNLDGFLQHQIDSSPTVPQAFMEMSRLMEQVFIQAQGHLPMFLEFWMQASREPEIWNSLIEPYRRYRLFFMNLINKGCQAGDITVPNPAISAQIVVALALGILLQGVIEPDEVNWGLTTQTAIETILNSWKT